MQQVAKDTKNAFKGAVKDVSSSIDKLKKKAN
jgi:hypothetical protein